MFNVLRKEIPLKQGLRRSVKRAWLPQGTPSPKGNSTKTRIKTALCTLPSLRSETPKGNSTKTRIKTSFEKSSNLDLELTPKGNSTKTRIKTLWLSPRCCQRCFPLRKEIPLKQGLRHFLGRHTSTGFEITPKGNSTKTRIKTSVAILTLPNMK